MKQTVPCAPLAAPATGCREFLRNAIASVLAVLAAAASFGADRPLPEWLKRATVYQMVLRNFTRDGTFRAAEAMLPHVRSAGVDVVYLTPFVEMDTDMDKSGWSNAQKRSGFDSPKNPYRVMDFNKVDPEYGTFDDWMAFQKRAHGLGMRVFLDLVYVHCGPNCTIKDAVPDAFQRNADGSVKTTKWLFPCINFASPATRRYLIDSTLFWMANGADGFRCDSGDLVPVDFWEELARACRKVKGDVVFINEGYSVEAAQRAFDANYGWPWSSGIRGFLNRKIAMRTHAKNRSLGEIMDRMRASEAKYPANTLRFVMMDNHDMASPKTDGDFRFDRVLPVEAGNAAFVLMFLRRGLPLLYNGNEIADPALTDFFGPVASPIRAWKTVDWGRALQRDGQKRLALIRRLANLHHDDPVFYDGTQEWLTSGEGANVVSFVRRCGSRAVFVAANLKDTPAAYTPEPSVRLDDSKRPVLAEGFERRDDGTLAFAPYGYVAVELADPTKTAHPGSPDNATGARR